LKHPHWQGRASSRAACSALTRGPHVADDGFDQIEARQAVSAQRIQLDGLGPGKAIQSPPGAERVLDAVSRDACPTAAALQLGQRATDVDGQTEIDRHQIPDGARHGLDLTFDRRVMLWSSITALHGFLD
jgi:hypothetical protein